MSPGCFCRDTHRLLSAAVLRLWHNKIKLHDHNHHRLWNRWRWIDENTWQLQLKLQLVLNEASRLEQSLHIWPHYLQYLTRPRESDFCFRRHKKNHDAKLWGWKCDPEQRSSQVFRLYTRQAHETSWVEDGELSSRVKDKDKHNDLWDLHELINSL